MRTTLEIDDDVVEAARTLSRRKAQGLGRTISELARKGLAPERESIVVDHQGVPAWIHGSGAIPVTSEPVHSLLDGYRRRLRNNFAETFHFWPADSSLLDPDLYHLDSLIGSRQTTDA